MGSGSSRTAPARSNKKQQANLTSPSTRSPMEQSTRSRPQLVTTQRNLHMHHQLQWPLPPNEDWPPFQLSTTDDPNRYALTDIRPRSPLADSSSSSLASSKEPYKHKVTSNKGWEKEKPDSQKFDSAHVQSQLSACFHACFNLAAADNIDVIMDRLRRTHTDLDNHLNLRLTEISTEAEKKIMLIIDDTKKEQQRLLIYDQEQQLHQDQVYKEWLQKYICALNEWRSKDLAKLQAQLLGYQQQIVTKSKRKIDRLNDEANDLKTKVLKEEQDAVIKKTSDLTAQIYDITRENTLYLGSESKTELNLRIHANVGRILPGESCTNDPVNEPMQL